MLKIFKEKNRVEDVLLNKDNFLEEYSSAEDVDCVLFPGFIFDHSFPMKNPLFQKKIAELQNTEQHFNRLDLAQEVYGQLASMMSNPYRKRLQKKYPLLKDKPLILLLVTDSVTAKPFPKNTIFFRTSGFASQRKETEFGLPHPIEWAEYRGPITNIVPSVGFCGNPDNHPSRLDLLQSLDSCKTIDCDFILRNGFWGHLKKKLSPAEKHRFRQEFFNNIHNNLFSVCSRGVGNFSIRFYETLRAGRIPVLLDTDMLFPCPELIDWNDIIICEKTPEAVEAKMLDWIENRDLIALQNRIRQVWEEYLYTPSFLNHMPAMVEKALPFL